MEETWLSPQEAGDEVGLSDATVREDCWRGLVPGAVRVKGKWRIPQSKIKEYRMPTVNQVITINSRQYLIIRADSTGFAAIPYDGECIE